MNNRSKLTILLILKDRVQFTYRWLEYYKYKLSNYKLLIADGSKNNSLEEYILKNYSNSNIVYRYYGPDISLEKYTLKVIRALKEVDTEYVLQSSNDDFYSSINISQNIDFLENNFEYSCSRNEIYDFSIESFQEVSGNLELRNKIYNDKCFNIDDTLSRVKTYAENFNSLWHDIARTKAMLYSWESLFRNKIFFFPFQDIYLSFILVTYGKINHSKGIYMLHQNHQEMLARDSSYGTITEFMNSNNLHHLSLTIDSITNEIANFSDNLDEKFLKYSFYHSFIVDFIFKAMKNEAILITSFVKRLKIFLKRALSSNKITYLTISLYKLLFKRKLIYKDSFVQNVNIFVSKKNFLFSKDFKIK